MKYLITYFFFLIKHMFLYKLYVGECIEKIISRCINRPGINRKYFRIRFSYPT